LLIGGAQRLADFGARATLLAAAGRLFGLGLLGLIGLAPPVVVILKSQIFSPAAGAAPARFMDAPPACPSSSRTMRRPTPRPIMTRSRAGNKKVGCWFQCSEGAGS